MGQSRLIEYGIQNEESDFRFHVSFFTGTAYRFPTKIGRQIVNDCIDGLLNYERFESSQPGTNQITGVGYKVPHEDIEECVEIPIPHNFLREADFDPDWIYVEGGSLPPPNFYNRSTSEKGRAAEKITELLLENQLVPLPLESKFIEQKDIQQQGKDFFIKAKIWIEAKCDAWGGRTGLRLQTHELNPFKRF